jgi:hypothetical protein
MNKPPVPNRPLPFQRLRLFRFIWSPEGREVCRLRARDSQHARGKFHSLYRNSYGRWMGEVRWEEVRGE